ncbi:uncharacterized protein LOC144144480 [Haemaphysalis longicornis]
MTLFPFYSERRNDTFHDDSHPVTRLLLDMAARARGGNFGLHLPQRKAQRIQEDLREDKAHRAMQSYWVFNNIRHYAVLDLEVRSLAYGVSTTVATTFGLLKVLRQQMDIYEGESGYKTRGYLVLGVRPWALTNDALFTELEKQLKSFPVDALVVRTHLFEDELASSYKNCRSTSPTPYEVRHSDYIMGLAATADYVSSRTWLVQRYSVAVSFSLCSRWYDTHPVLKLGRRCKPPGWTGVPISLACSIKERDYFANLTFDRKEHSMYSWTDKRWMIALDTVETMKWKICQTVKRHSSVSFGIALFDVECEDWARECTTPAQAPFRGAPRLREVSRFFRREVTPTAGRDLPCQ